jgi:CheY-like chemotaxis protein
MKVWIIDDEVRYLEKAESSVKDALLKLKKENIDLTDTKENLIHALIHSKLSIEKSRKLDWPPEFISLPLVDSQNFPDLVILDLYLDDFAVEQGTDIYYNLRQLENDYFGQARAVIIFWSGAILDNKEIITIDETLDDKLKKMYRNKNELTFATSLKAVDKLVTGIEKSLIRYVQEGLYELSSKDI